MARQSFMLHQGRYAHKDVMPTSDNARIYHIPSECGAMKRNGNGRCTSPPLWFQCGVWSCGIHRSNKTMHPNPSVELYPLVAWIPPPPPHAIRPQLPPRHPPPPPSSPQSTPPPRPSIIATRPLQPSVSTFPMFECSICTESCSGNQTPYESPCKHLFHFACISKWANTIRSTSGSTRRITCPLCRSTISR